MIILDLTHDIQLRIQLYQKAVNEYHAVPEFDRGKQSRAYRRMQRAALELREELSKISTTSFSQMERALGGGSQFTREDQPSLID